MTTFIETPRAWLNSNNFQMEAHHDRQQVLEARQKQQRLLRLLVVARNTLLVVFALLAGFSAWASITQSIPVAYQAALVSFLVGIVFISGVLEGLKGDQRKELTHSIHLNSPSSPQIANNQVERLRDHLTGWLSISSANETQKERIHGHLDWLHRLIQEATPAWAENEPHLRPLLYQSIPAIITEHAPSGKHLTRDDTNQLLAELISQEETMLRQDWTPDTLEQTNTVST